MVTKRIYAIRHGQSEWNVLYKTIPSDERYHPKMKTIDCGITTLGKEQSLEAGRQLAAQLATDTNRRIDHMVISPLRRALQTATHVLEAFPEDTPIVEISELCSEMLRDACDIGTVPSELAKEFPHWDFSRLDQFWWHGGLNGEETWILMQQQKIQESETQVIRRISALKRYLRSLEGETIVVVCHSDFIWLLTSEQKNNAERTGIYPKNGEIVDITRHVIL